MPHDLPFSISRSHHSHKPFPPWFGCRQLPSCLPPRVYQLALSISISCPLLAIVFNVAPLSKPSSLKNTLVGGEEFFSDLGHNLSNSPCLDSATIIRCQYHPPTYPPWKIFALLFLSHLQAIAKRGRLFLRRRDGRAVQRGLGIVGVPTRE